ncbi:hypothetical protein EI94DRAFT_1474545, partial [Lactarius quietus]
RWHQLVGVTRMVQCTQTSKPVLLMDDVRLGKTLQVITFFAIISYYRKFYEVKQKYPGMWGGWEKGALPNYPFLIVVPPTLVVQVMQECKHFLKKGFMDVIEY